MFVGGVDAGEVVSLRGLGRAEFVTNAWERRSPPVVVRRMVRRVMVMCGGGVVPCVLR